MSFVGDIRDAAVRKIGDSQVYNDIASRAQAIPMKSDDKSLKIIGAGFSRTATLSMYAAMTELGIKSYHGMELGPTPGVYERWRHVLEIDLKQGNTDGVDWEDVVQGYEAGFDAPFADYWYELSQAFPDAKIVYTRRDGHAWLNSILTAIIQPMSHNVWHRLAAFWFPRIEKGIKIAVLLEKKYMRDYGGPHALAGLRPECIEERLEAIKRVVPPERLLVFHPSEGWEKLCPFLGVPIPASPFPKVNDGPSMVWALRAITIVGMGIWAVVIAVPSLGVAAWWMTR